MKGEGYSKYFYLHDRLGSVRQVIDSDGDVVNYYTFGPFGELLTAETAENTENPFKFTGQYYDVETGQYYLRARQYDPQLMRFTSKDPVKGWSTQSMTLHAYLYSQNDPINYTDPTGLYFSAALLLNNQLRKPYLEHFGRIYETATQMGQMEGLDALVDMVDLTAFWANRVHSTDQFMEDLLWLFTERGPNMERVEGNLRLRFADTGFRGEYLDGSGLQVRHFVGCIGAGYYFGRSGGTLGLWWNERRDWDNVADRTLGYKGIDLGSLIMGYFHGGYGWPMSWKQIELGDVGDWIRKNIGE